MSLTLHRLQTELYAFSSNVLGWLQGHEIGTQNHLKGTGGAANKVCQALGEEKDLATGTSTTKIHWHTHLGADSGSGGAGPTDGGFCIAIDDTFWSTGLGSALLKACGYGAAFLLVVGAYQGVRAAMRGQSGGLTQGLKAAFPFMIFSAMLGGIAALPTIIIPTMARLIQLVFELLNSILA